MKTRPSPGALAVGADFAMDLQMLFKNNSVLGQATQGGLVLHCTLWPLNSRLLFTNQSMNVFPPSTLKALCCGNQ